MKKMIRKTLALLLCLIFVGQVADVLALAEELQPTERYFDDAVIPSELEEENLFLFGSRNMVLSEKSRDCGLLKIIRTGDCSSEAAVTVKFTDLSAAYGENYTVSAPDGTKPVAAKGRISLVKFLQENAETQTEETPLSEEALLALTEEAGGFDTVDAAGNVISSVTVRSKGTGTDGEDTGVKLTSEQITAVQNITEENSGEIADVFPGTELRLNFAPGEREKTIAVKPKYSRKADGDCIVSLSLKDPSGDVALREDSFASSLTITDEDAGEPAVLTLEQAEYTADGDSVFVTVKRSGAINEMVSANLCTVSDTAEIGVDFQGVDAPLYFPMGVESRTVEIMVNHNSEETLDFDVKLVSPVNCSTLLSTAKVSIAPASGVVGTRSIYDAYCAPKLQPGDFSCFGNAWNTDPYWFKYSCKGVDYDTWNGGTYSFDNPYLYDGIRLKWQAKYSGWFSISYTYIKMDGKAVYYSERTEWDSETDDIIFGAYTDSPANRNLWFGSLTSYFNGIQVDVQALHPIYRSFNFNLEQVEPMRFLGVDDESAKAYTAVQFGGELDTTKTINTTVGGKFSVCAPKSQPEYARLEGLRFLDQNGEELYYLKNTSNTRSVSVDVTKELLSVLACDSLKYDKQDYDGRYVGNITVQPVFSYIDAAVTVKPGEFGDFVGDYAASGSPRELEGLHLGDQLTLSAETAAAYAGKYLADGVRYEKRDEEGKLLVNGSGQIDFGADGALTFLVDSPVITLTPTFRKNDNAVRVRVRKQDVEGPNAVFDTANGIFVVNSGRVADGEYYVYTVSGASVHLDQLICLNAVPLDSGAVSVWTLPGAVHPFSGNAFYFSAGREKEDNLLTLSVAAAGLYSFTGMVMNADKNLSTGRASTAPVLPAEGALVCAGSETTMAGDDGSFALGGISGAAETCSRLMIYHNNRWNFKDVYLNPALRSYDLGVVTAAANSTDCAYFTNVYCDQDGSLITSAEQLSMNGRNLKLYAAVKDGMKYIINGTERTEHVTDVTFYVLDGISHEIKSAYPAKAQGDGIYMAEIRQFAPDHPEDYTYGDCFYVAMTTDRVRSEVTDENGEIPAAFRSTTYAMLSTGYEIVRDETYQPQTFAMSLPISAAQVLGGSDGGTKKSYASLPFIGAIDTAVSVFGFMMPSSVQTDDEGSEEQYNPTRGTKRAQVRVSFSFTELPYGGTRLNIGVTVATGNQAWAQAMSYNPIEAFEFSLGGSGKAAAGSKVKGDGIDRIFNQTDGLSKVKDQFETSFGNRRMSFGVYFGIYIDFGIIVTTDLETGHSTDLSESDWEFLGIGGFLGFSGSVEFQWFGVSPTVIPVPGYVGVVGSASVTGYLGGSKDPDKVLKYSDCLDEKNTFHTDDMSFNADIIVNASLKGYFGVGVPDVIGARVILGFKGSFAYSPYLEDHYAPVEDTWGLGAEFTVGGQLDVIVTRIPVDGFSVPLFSAGFTEYFVWLKRANKLVNYTLQAIEDKGANFSQSYLDGAKELCDQLSSDINNEAGTEQLRADFETLLGYVYGENLHLISTTERNLLYMVTPYDIWLANSDDEEATQSIAHVNSRWVGNQPVLRGAFQEETETQPLVRDSYSQPSAKLADLGGGRLLCVFLMDTSAAGETVNPTLMWAVYDTASRRCVAGPTAFQTDGTVDYTPSVCDAGDRVLITWASAKNPFAAYASDCEMMQDLEICATFFDKQTERPAPVEQLTDDDYMDYKPSAIYDDESGSMAVYYLKNGVDSDQITEYVVAESIVCYRLYEDGKWITDYYPDEYPDLSAEELAEFGGQRFLNSAVGDEDLPISDLSVCGGYNGLGIYAYTVDLDGDPTGDEDTELFLRIFDFRTHKNYSPIRVTDDAVSQSLPQLVRSNVPYMDYYDSEAGEQISGTTYLFWLEDGCAIRYLSVTDLIRHGLAEDGSSIAEDYPLEPVEINTTLKDGSGSTLSSYQALTDAKNNLYVLWTQACADGEDEDVTVPAALEIFAAAQIRSETPGSMYDAATGSGGMLGSAWSAPYRLTESGACNDGVFGLVAESGKLFAIHNRWTVQYIGDTEEYLATAAVDENGQQSGNPYVIGPTNLMLTSFAPIGTVSTEKFRLSDETPCSGDTVTVTATVENTGLTTAEGYTLEFYEARDGVRGQLLAQFSETEWLAANASKEVSFDWTLPAEIEGLQVLCAARENGYTNETVTCSEALTPRTDYEITLSSLQQKGDHFAAEFTVANRGNLDGAADDQVEIEFAALYGAYDSFYGLETPLLAAVPLGGIAAGSEQSYVSEFAVPESALEYCGYDAAVLTVRDQDGIALSDPVSGYLVLEEPMSAHFTQSGLQLNAGDRKTLGVDVGNSFLAKRAKIRYSVADNSVAMVSADGELTGVGKGTTEVTACILPFGTELTMGVTVSGELPIPEDDPEPENGAESAAQTMPFTDVTETDYFHDAVLWAVNRDVTTGVSETLFAPALPCTRAQMVTFLWRAAGCPKAEKPAEFTDVPADSWYAEAVAWAAEQEITLGIGGGLFAPDQTVTRGQTVTFLCRFAGNPAPKQGTNPFSDVREADYYYNAVLWAAEQGITNGMGGGLFAPNNDCTRGQIVTFLYRFIHQK